MRALLQPGRLYVIDRGYAEYQLFQDIIDAKSGFIGRIRDNAVWQLVEERPTEVQWAATMPARPACAATGLSGWGATKAARFSSNLCASSKW